MAKACPRRVGSAEYGRPAPVLEEKRTALLEGLIGAVQRKGADPAQII